MLEGDRSLRRADHIYLFLLCSPEKIICDNNFRVGLISQEMEGFEDPPFLRNIKLKLPYSEQVANLTSYSLSQYIILKQPTKLKFLIVTANVPYSSSQSK